MHINDIPTELLIEIFSYLPQPFVATSLTFVCTRWKELSSAPVLWRRLNLYHQSMFLSKQKKNLDSFLNKIGYHVHKLKTRTTCIYRKYEPAYFTELKLLHLRMYDTDEIEKLRQTLLCFKDLESLKLDISKYDGLSDVIAMCKQLQKLTHFHLRHFFCNHSANLKLMPHTFQVFFQNTKILTRVTINCGDIYLDSAVQSLLRENLGLVDLNLSRCTGITSAAFEGMSPCNLKYLTLDRTAINDDTLKTVADNSPFLRLLSVSKCENVTDKGMQYIGLKCKLLQSLKLNDFTENECCRVTNLGLKLILEGCPNLCSLNFNLHPFIQADITTFIGEMCKNIRILKMENIRNISDLSLTVLAQNCKFLYYVVLSHCPEVTGKGVSNLLTECRWLNHAGFNSCRNVSDISLDGSAVLDCTDTHNASPDETDFTEADVTPVENHSHIQSLHFRYCQNLTSESIISISLFCPDLTEFVITGWTTGNIDEAIAQIVRRCKNLRILTCNGHDESSETNFTNQSLEAMASYGQNLTQLNFALNNFITIEGLQKVILSCNRLQQIDFLLDNNSSLSVQDVEKLLSEYCPQKVAFHKYQSLSSTNCQIYIRQHYQMKHW